MALATPPQTEAPEDFNEMLDEYYKLRRWDKEGRPTKEKLREPSLT
jgi:aldehyde:ferredoxin oxidoreductase